jgi:hypothetical protein
MKMLHSNFALLLLTSLFLLSNLSSACKCQPPSLNDALFNNLDSIVIAGRIIDEIKTSSSSSTSNEMMDRLFAFRVQQVYKVCPSSGLQAGDLILVSTRSSTAACGLNLQPFTSYIFSALPVESNTNTTNTTNDMNPLNSVFQVSVQSCDYNAELPIAANLKQTLRQFRNNATNVQFSNCGPPSPPPTPCQTGQDCNASTEYCKPSTSGSNPNGTCIAINAPCPTPIVDCFAEPCAVTDPCLEYVPGTCLNNYCGGCNAIFLNVNRTQVCLG